MRYFDLHCDTATFAHTHNNAIDSKIMHINFSEEIPFTSWCQLFAVFIPDDLRGKAALDYFNNVVAYFKKQVLLHSQKVELCKTMQNVSRTLRQNKCAAILSVEGGAVLAGELRNVEYIKKIGVKALGLTWNGPNELGFGSAENKGLTEFGVQVVQELVRQKIAVDVSHLSDAGFYDVCNVISEPFIATHSNARKICSHVRNLTDEQFIEIRNRGGLVGMNFYYNFLRDTDSENAGIDDIIAHMEHFLSLGGENIVAIGSDFDGAGIHPEINSVYKIDALQNRMLRRNFSDTLVDKILFKNAYQFFQKIM